MQVIELKAFVRCAEAGTLSGAARAEQLPKSRLSRLIRELERGLAVDLFERSSRGLVLTDEGRALLPHARRVLDSINVAAAAVSSFKEGPIGDVRITAPYTFGATFIAPLLPAFLEAHPRLNVHVELTSRNVDLVEEGFDMAVRIGPPPPGLVAHRLVSNRLKLCASAEYCAKFGAPTTPSELRKHPLLLIGTPRAKSSLRLSNGREHITVTSPARLLSSDPAVILQAVAKSAGIGQVPVMLAQEQLQRGTLIPVLTAWSLPTVDISLIYARGHALAPRVKALRDYLRTHIRTPPESASM